MQRAQVKREREEEMIFIGMACTTLPITTVGGESCKYSCSFVLKYTD